jgi:hypothetical protein
MSKSLELATLPHYIHGNVQSTYLGPTNWQGQVMVVIEEKYGEILHSNRMAQFFPYETRSN